MKQSINLYDFERAFAGHDRQDQFSYEGKRALFDYLEQYEEDCGEEIELDVIALCCDYAEYDSATDCACEFFDFEIDHEAVQWDDEAQEIALKYLRDRTQVIEFDGGIIIQQF